MYPSPQVWIKSCWIHCKEDFRPSVSRCTADYIHHPQPHTRVCTHIPKCGWKRFYNSLASVLYMDLVDGVTWQWRVLHQSRECDPRGGQGGQCVSTCVLSPSYLPPPDTDQPTHVPVIGAISPLVRDCSPVNAPCGSSSRSSSEEQGGDRG